VAVIYQCLYPVDHLMDVARCPRRNVRSQDIQPVHVCKVTSRIVLGELHRLHLLAPGALYDPVLTTVQDMSDVRDVLDIEYLVAHVAQVADHDIKVDIGLAMSQVRIVIDRGTADIHMHTPGVQGFKELFFAGKRVVD